MWKLKVDDKTFYQFYLQILNGILKLTRTERLVLAQFMDIKYTLSKSGIQESLKRSMLFSSESRKQVQHNLEISEANLNNYIKLLKDKRMIINGDINSKIYIDKNDGQTLSFKLEFD